MNAQRLLGEIYCRGLGELCSIITLVLLQQERWKKQVLLGWSVWNYLSWIDYGLESCVCLQLSFSSCYSGWSGDAPGVHPYVHALLEKPGRAEQSCVSQRAARKAALLLVPSWSFSDPHSWVLCLAKIVRDQDTVVPRLMNRGVRDWSGMLWRQGCRHMKVSYQLEWGLCSHTHEPFTSWLSNGFWNWAHDTRECSVCVWGNEQTSLNRMPGWRSIHILVSEMLISPHVPQVKRSYFFSVFAGERIII